MNKLAILDIDGVIADASLRFQAAKMRADDLYPGDSLADYDYRNAYWRCALSDEYVHLDIPVSGANDLLNRLGDDGYHLIFLTSRPLSMSDATYQWFGFHVHLENMTFNTDIVFKAPGFQYVKTPVWKVGMAQTLMAMYEAEAEDTIFVDDEHTVEGLKCYKSLAAVFAPESSDDPFLPDFPD